MLDLAKESGDLIEDLLVAHVSRYRDDEAVGGVVARHELQQGVTAQGSHARARADDGPS